MVYKGMIQVNGTWIPTPAAFEYSTEDRDTEGFETTDGTVHRHRVGKRGKLTCSWDIVPDTQEYYDFFRLLDNLPEFFPVSFPYPDGTRKTLQMYRGNPLSASMRSYWNEGSKKISKWKDTKCNFIEQYARKY